MKKTIALILILIMGASSVFSTGGREMKATKIDAKTAKSMIDKGNVVIVDVRRVDEYEASHIPQAILIPNESILTQPPVLLPDKDATILIYCRSGRRSAEAASKLVKMGYEHIYDFGGIIDWPYETT